jgi:hypothetical protein
MASVPVLIEATSLMAGVRLRARLRLSRRLGRHRPVLAFFLAGPVWVPIRPGDARSSRTVSWSWSE